ncbi:MAG: lipid A biosynthesis acyltransferase [Nevskiales bacterium]
MSDPRDWKQHKERSSPATLALIVWIALHLGRGFARALLPPIVAYFFLTAGAARRASRQFLQRAGAPQQGLCGVLRHIHTFAACALDRVFLLSGRHRKVQVTVHDPDGLLPYFDKHGGALVPTAHLGSFEALRVIGVDLKGIRFRIVMDRGHGSMISRVLDRLNPQLAAEIIDAGRGGPEMGLALKEALQQGCIVGLMADRLTGNDPGVAVRFMGGMTRLPVSPWRLAAVLGAPVILCFCLYRGGSHYELHFEKFLDGAVVPRQARAAFTQECAQRYAERVEYHARSAPYNWFNFYDFWADDSPRDH